MNDDFDFTTEKLNFALCKYQQLSMKKIKEIIAPLESYKGIIYFLFLLFFFHFSWKIAIDGDMDSEFIYLFGKDITPDWFNTASRWLTQAASWFVHLFPNTDDLVTKGSYLYFPNGKTGINIIWGCTGIKQMFIFSGIMICYFGPCLKKLWYIPMGCILLTVYNVIRIGSITMLTNGHPEKFDSLHNGIFRYIYYTIIFLLWLYWEEKMIKKHKKHDNQRENPAST
jgi:exosortase/archaeosortase family protein